MPVKTLLPEVKPAVANKRQPQPSKLDEVAYKSADEVFEMLGTSRAGLSEDEAARRLEEYGPNEVAYEKKESWLQRLWFAARNPLVILLTVLAILSYSTGDFAAGTIMMLMVVLGISLRFVQETRADNAAAKL